MNKIPEDIKKLIDIYIKAQENLIKTIAEKEAKGSTAAYQKSLLKQVMQILQDLDNEAKKWSNDTIPDYYQQGIDDAIQGLKDLGQDVGSVNFNQIHQGAIQAIVNSCYGDLNNVNNYIGRHIQDTIRQAGIDAVTNKIATGQTVKECKQNIVNKFIDEGVNAIKDKRGRNISLNAYASTVARSTTREATNTATTNQLTGLGYDLVKMSSHLTTCPLCATYQGRVYSISGNSPDYPPLDTAFSGDYANIHPNCVHVISPYIPELDDNADSLKEFSNRSFDISEVDKKTIDDYNKQQADKRQLRDDRNQYQKYKSLLPDDVPKDFANFRKLKYNNSDKWTELKDNYRKINAYNKIIINEPAITKDLQEVSKSTGVKMVGLEYRLKTKESYLRKVNTDSKNSIDGKIIDQTIKGTNDVIRYTYQGSADKLVDKYFEVNNRLSDKGYSEIKVKNFWMNKSSAYKGVNCTFEHPNGQKFEVQFHTPESFELKNGELHKLYEEARLDNTTPERRTQIDKIMFELSSKLIDPKDINKISQRR